MSYREYFHVEIDHQYFSVAPSSLTLVPDESTVQLLRRQHLIMKKTAKGIVILIPVNGDNQAASQLESEDNFVFHVFPTSGTINELTDTSVAEEGEILSFTNIDTVSDNNPVELTVSSTESKASLKGFPALAQVTIASSVIDLAAVTPIVYHAVFKSTLVKWKYYFLADSDTTSLRVETRNGIAFNELSQSDTEVDPVTIALRSNFPDEQVQIRAFESSEPIPYRDKPIKHIKLLKNDLPIRAHLPNPEPKDTGIQIIKLI